MTTYPSSGLIKYAPVIFSKKVMKLFTEATICNEITNNDFQGEITGKGDKVEIRVAPTSMNVNDYVINTDIIFETPGEEARELLIDQSKYVAFKLDEVDKIQSDIGLMNVFAERAANSLDIDTSRSVLSTMGLGAGNVGLTAGKISNSFNLGVAGTPIQITAANALESIVDLGTVLDEADVPQEGRFIVLPAWFCNYLKKGDLKRADVTGDSTGLIRTGLIGEIDTFKVYRSNLLKTVVDSNINLPTAFHVVAGVTDATTFASQVTKTETTPVENGFGEKWKSLLVYGKKVIQPEALAMLYCTKDAVA